MSVTMLTDLKNKFYIYYFLTREVLFTIAKPWLKCDYLSTVKTMFLICSKTTFNFRKRIYVIKTLCYCAKKCRWAILPCADITVATVWAIWLLILFFYFFTRRQHIEIVRSNKSIYSSSRWQKKKKTKKHVLKNYYRSCVRKKNRLGRFRQG